MSASSAYPWTLTQEHYIRALEALVGHRRAVLASHVDPTSDMVNAMAMMAALADGEMARIRAAIGLLLVIGGLCPWGRALGLCDPSEPTDGPNWP